MKNKIYLLLLLMVLAACRSDYLQDAEHRDQGGQDAVVSKIISLNQSEHKSKIAPILSKIRHTLKSNVLGKNINYGDSISIDTDQVVYIEYRAYHTFTFKIDRNGADENAPVENLILSLESDGTYKELLKTYYPTEADWDVISSGGDFDPTGKSKTIEVPKGTYGNNLQAKSSTCNYESQTVIRPCRVNRHNETNLHLWYECEYSGNQGPRIFTIEVLVCEDDNEDNPGGWDPGSSPINTYIGGGPLGNTVPNPNPENPPNPSDVAEAQEELGGVITLPNIGLNPRKTPCEKAKIPVSALNNLLNSTEISTEIASIKNHAQNSSSEYGITITKANATSPNVATVPYTDNNCCQVAITYPQDATYISSGHTHPPGGASPPSVGDFYIHLEQAVNSNLSNYAGSFVFAHDGSTFAFVITDRQAAATFLAAYPKATNYDTGSKTFNKNSEVGIDFNTIYNAFNSGKFPNYSIKSQNDALETAFAYILGKYDIGIAIAKTTSTGDLKPLKSVPFEYEIPFSGGKKVTAYKTETCD